MNPSPLSDGFEGRSDGFALVVLENNVNVEFAVVHAGEGFDSVGTGCFEDGGFNADDEPWAHYFVGFAFWCCFQGRILFTRSTSHFDVFVWDFDSMVVLKG